MSAHFPTPTSEGCSNNEFENHQQLWMLGCHFPEAIQKHHRALSYVTGVPDADKAP